MDTKEIAKIAKWMETTDLEEITFRNKENKLSLKQKNDIYSQNFKIQANLISINSPYIGIFKFSEKGKNNKIKEGDFLKKDQIIGYVEVLKELKEIKSSVDGIVKIVAVEDNACVEYSQPLFFIEPK